jgi:hypothetical protein
MVASDEDDEDDEDELLDIRSNGDEADASKSGAFDVESGDGTC